MIPSGNLFVDRPSPEVGEVFEPLLRRPPVRIERICSSPYPEQAEYDQSGDEWVALLTGRATLEVAGETVEISAGDYLFLPAHTRHRVLSTSSEPRCTWLAVHIDTAGLHPKSFGAAESAISASPLGSG